MKTNETNETNETARQLNAEQEARRNKAMLPTTETKHTPGKWYLTAKNPNADGSCYQQIKSEIIGSAVMGLSHDGSPEAYANAGLLTSAPAMLDALKRVTEFLSEAHAEDKAAAHYGDDPDTCTYCQAINQANAAIAQAQGGGE